jgi:hypothetical protein
VEEGPGWTDGGRAGFVCLEVAEVSLDVVGGERGNSPFADGGAHVATPYPFVSPDGVGTQVLPTVLLPSLDGVVDGRLRIPRLLSAESIDPSPPFPITPNCAPSGHRSVDPG